MPKIALEARANFLRPGDRPQASEAVAVTRLSLYSATERLKHPARPAPGRRKAKRRNGVVKQRHSRTMRRKAHGLSQAACHRSPGGCSHAPGGTHTPASAARMIPSKLGFRWCVWLTIVAASPVYPAAARLWPYHVTEPLRLSGVAHVSSHEQHKQKPTGGVYVGGLACGHDENSRLAGGAVRRPPRHKKTPGTVSRAGGKGAKAEISSSSRASRSKPSGGRTRGRPPARRRRCGGDRSYGRSTRFPCSPS